MFRDSILSVWRLMFDVLSGAAKSEIATGKPQGPFHFISFLFLFSQQRLQTPYEYPDSQELINHACFALQ